MKKSLLLFVLFCSAIFLYTTGFYIGLVIVLIFGGIFVFLALRSYGNRRFIEKKTIAALKIKKWQPGDYEYVYEKNSSVGAYVSRLNNKIKINVIYVAKNKNMFVFATSLAHNLTEKDKKVLLAFIPQLVDVNINERHEVTVTKSRAVSLHSFKKVFLELLFDHLYHSYKWMLEEQKITILRIEKNELNASFLINMRSEIYDWLYLERQLRDIKGVTEIYCRDALFGPKGNLTSTERNISFIISRSYDSDWEEMLLKIQQVFANHIQSGFKIYL